VKFGGENSNFCSLLYVFHVSCLGLDSTPSFDIGDDEEQVSSTGVL